MSRAWRYLFIKMIVDILLINVAFISAFMVKFRTIDIISTLTIYSRPLFFITVLWLVVLNLAGLYKLQQDKIGRLDNIIVVSFGGFSAAFFAYLIVVFFCREALYTKDIIIIGSLIALVLVNVSRYLIWKLFRR